MASIHDDRKRLESLVERLPDTELSDRNVELLLDFKHHLEAQNASTGHVLRHLYSFKSLAPEIDFDLDEAEKSEVREMVAAINRNDVNGKDYSVHTLAKFKKALSRFYRWHTDEDDPEIIDFLTTHVKKSEKPKTDPSELPTPEDVRRMLKAARNTRDRALLFTLWDTGGRIGEVLNLEWRDVHFDQDLTEVRFRESKTGERIVPVRECVPALKEWREKHPKADDTNAYVFVSKNTSTAEGEAYEKQLSYRKALDVVKYVDDKGGIGKDLSPHGFRKGRATWLASQGMNAAQLMEYFGWNQMETAETYVRLAKKDLENAVRKIQGMETDENGAEPMVEDLKPIRCGNCETINAADHDFCTDCGNPLAQRAGLLQTSKKREIRENVKTDMLMEFLQEMGIPEDEARERFDQMTDSRMEKQGLM